MPGRATLGARPGGPPPSGGNPSGGGLATGEAIPDRGIPSPVGDGRASRAALEAARLPTTRTLKVGNRPGGPAPSRAAWREVPTFKVCYKYSPRDFGPGPQAGGARAASGCQACMRKRAGGPTRATALASGCQGRPRKLARVYEGQLEGRPQCWRRTPARRRDGTRRSPKDISGRACEARNNLSVSARARPKVKRRRAAALWQQHLGASI